MKRGGAEEATRHLTPGDFYEHRHATLYDHILELWGMSEAERQDIADRAAVAVIQARKRGEL